MQNISLSGSYTFSEGTLSHTSENLALEFKTEDSTSEYGIALYIKSPIRKRIGRLFKNQDWWYFDTYPDKHPYKLTREGLTGYVIQDLT